MDAMCELTWNRERNVEGEENIDVCALLVGLVAQSWRLSYSSRQKQPMLQLTSIR